MRFSWCLHSSRRSFLFWFGYLSWKALLLFTVNVITFSCLFWIIFRQTQLDPGKRPNALEAQTTHLMGFWCLCDKPKSHRTQGFVENKSFPILVIESGAARVFFSGSFCQRTLIIPCNYSKLEILFCSYHDSIFHVVTVVSVLFCSIWGLWFWFVLFVFFLNPELTSHLKF